MSYQRTKSEIQRIGGYLKEVVTVLDESGNPISHAINPLMIELKPRDVLQIFVGAFLVASPLCFTEEVWNLSDQLPAHKIETLQLTSFLFVTAFIYLNFYRFRFRGNVINFLKRSLATYLITLASVAYILFLIDKLPYETDFNLAYKRVILIGFPSVFGATLSDYIK